MHKFLNAFGDTLEFMLPVAAITLLCFIFGGDPDLYDKWQKAAHVSVDARIEGCQK